MSKNLQIAYLLDFYENILTEKQRDAMQQYYYEDLSLAEISENQGISRQGVRDSLKRSEAFLLDLEKALGFAQKNQQITQAFSEIEHLVKQIRFYNLERGTADFEITNSCEDILKLIHNLPL